MWILVIYWPSFVSCFSIIYPIQTCFSFLFSFSFFFFLYLINKLVNCHLCAHFCNLYQNLLTKICGHWGWFKCCDPGTYHWLTDCLIARLIDWLIDRSIDRSSTAGKWISRFRPHSHCFSTFVTDQNVLTKMGFPEVIQAP